MCVLFRSNAGDTLKKSTHLHVWCVWVNVFSFTLLISFVSNSSRSSSSNSSSSSSSGFALRREIP